MQRNIFHCCLVKNRKRTPNANSNIYSCNRKDEHRLINFHKDKKKLFNQRRSNKWSIWNHLWFCFYAHLTFLTFPADKWTKSALSLWPTADLRLFGWATQLVYMSHTIINMMSLMSQCLNVLHNCHVPCINQTLVMQEISRLRTCRDLHFLSTKAYCMSFLPHCNTDQIMYELRSSKNEEWMC